MRIFWVASAPPPQQLLGQVIRHFLMCHSSSLPVASLTGGLSLICSFSQSTVSANVELVSFISAVQYACRWPSRLAFSITRNMSVFLIVPLLSLGRRGRYCEFQLAFPRG